MPNLPKLNVAWPNLSQNKRKAWVSRNNFRCRKMLVISTSSQAELVVIVTQIFVAQTRNVNCKLVIFFLSLDLLRTTIRFLNKNGGVYHIIRITYTSLTHNVYYIYLFPETLGSLAGGLKMMIQMTTLDKMITMHTTAIIIP